MNFCGLAGRSDVIDKKECLFDWKAERFGGWEKMPMRTGRMSLKGQALKNIVGAGWLKP